VKKKYSLPSKDKNDWEDFTKKINNISIKEEDILENFKKKNKIPRLDLHGYSLDGANKIVKEFITESFNKNYKKLIIITGKGTRSKSYDNPYVSDALSILKNSIPEFIRNDENLNSIISKVTQATREDGGEGALNIFLKDSKKFRE